ncbi:MAG: hypothetical protein Q9164_003408 [Protoblastenia rupestris]
MQVRAVDVEDPASKPPLYQHLRDIALLRVSYQSYQPPTMAPDPSPPSSTFTPTSTLQADYISPTTSQTFTHILPSASASNQSTKQKTQYLSSLRRSVVQLQDEVNGFLTTKMEEDKALATGKEGKVDEKREEDLYGEDVMEEEG